MAPIAFLKRLRDFGVPDDMPPEDAKYVRALNIGLVIASAAFLAWTTEALLAGEYGAAVIYAAWIVLLLADFILARARQYLLAKVSLVVLFNLHSIIAAVYINGLYHSKWNLLFAALTPLLFSRRETGWMFALIGLSVASYFAKAPLGPLASPLYPHPVTGSDFGDDVAGATVFWLLLIAGPVIYRAISIRSDEMLKDEKKKVHLLSEKLKLYLPRQFVESLASGERDTAPDYRRKRLTIFFSDVQGFTKWTDKLEPEEVREILNHYLSEMSAIAMKWGGTIDKFIGDCLMIFFGDPEFTNDRDHAVRCVKMAIEMQAKMAELRAGWRKMAYDEPLNIRIGINTGWATVGNFGSNDRLNYTALGSAVNLASRIESSCAADKITVSHTTFLLIEDEISCEPKGSIEVKGFSEPVKIYEVRGKGADINRRAP